MSTTKKIIPTIKPMDKYSLDLNKKVINSDILSSNENAKIPPAAEISIRTFEDSSSSSSNSSSNLKAELKLNNNYKIKNSEFQIINDYSNAYGKSNEKEVISQGIIKKKPNEQAINKTLNLNSNNNKKYIPEFKETPINDSNHSSKTEGLLNNIPVKSNPYYKDNNKLTSSNNYCDTNKYSRTNSNSYDNTNNKELLTNIYSKSNSYTNDYSRNDYVKANANLNKNNYTNNNYHNGSKNIANVTDNNRNINSHSHYNLDNGTNIHNRQNNNNKIGNSEATKNRFKPQHYQSVNSSLNYDKQIISDETNKKYDYLHSRSNSLKSQNSYHNHSNDKLKSNKLSSYEHRKNSFNSSRSNSLSSLSRDDISKIKKHKINRYGSSSSVSSTLVDDKTKIKIKNKDTSHLVRSLSQSSSRDNSIKKNHKSHYDEDLSVNRREKFRDIAPILPSRESEGESDFDFSESLITNRKRKRCKSVFDIYFEARKGISKHSSSSNYHERNEKHSKENKISKDITHISFKDKDKDKEKEKKKLINNNQSFGNKKIQNNEQSKYNNLSDDDKEKVRKNLDEYQDSEKTKKLKAKKVKTNSKYENDLSLYYYRRQPPRSCRSENGSVSSKYYGMYSSEDNISEIEELFADLDNQRNRSEMDDSAIDDENDYEDNSNGYDKSKNNKNSLKSKKSLKYKSSLASLHSISEEVSPSPAPKTKKMKIKDFDDKETEKVEEDKFSREKGNSNKRNDTDKSRSRLDKEAKRLKEKMLFKRLKEQRNFLPLSKIKSSHVRNISKLKLLNSSFQQDLEYEDELSYFHDAIDENENDYDYELEDENENDYDYQESDTDSDYTNNTANATTSQKAKSFTDDPKKYRLQVLHNKQQKLKKIASLSSLTSRHHRTATNTTEESSYLYDDMDSNSGWDDILDKKDKLGYHKRNSLSKINEDHFDIPKEDEEDNEEDEQMNGKVADNNDKDRSSNKYKYSTKIKIETPTKKQKFTIVSNNSKSSKSTGSHSSSNSLSQSHHRPHLSSNSTSILLTTSGLSSTSTKKIINKNDRYESDGYTYSHSKDHSDTHIIFKSTAQPLSKSTSLKARILGQSLKKNKSTPTPEKKIKVKMVSSEEGKTSRFDLFGKKLKSKAESIESFNDDIYRKFKIKSKYTDEPEVKLTDTEDELEDEIEDMIKEEVDRKRKDKKIGEFDDDYGMDGEEDEEIEEDENINIDNEEEEEENEEENEAIEGGFDRNMFTDSDSILIDTPSKPSSHKRLKMEKRSVRVYPKQQPIITIGSIQNPTLLSRSRFATTSNENSASSGSDTNNAKMKKTSQDIPPPPVESSTLVEHKLLTQEVIEQLNRLNVTEDEYDITPSINAHSNIYIKNELFKLLNYIVDKEGLDPHIDNYTTIFGNSAIDPIDPIANRKKDIEIVDLTKGKEEDLSIHYLCRESSNLSQALVPPSISTTVLPMTTNALEDTSISTEPSLANIPLPSSSSFVYDSSSLLTPDPEKSMDDLEIDKFKSSRGDKSDGPGTLGTTYLPTPLDSSMEESTKPSTPIKSFLSSSNSSCEIDPSALSIEDSGSKGPDLFDLKLNEASTTLPLTEEDYPYNYSFAESIKNKIYHTLKTVDLLRDELYQLKFNRLKHEEDLIKKNIHPGFEIQQNSLKEELFNRIKFAKKNREASLNCIHKTYQTNLRLINNSFIDNKHKLRLELNRKISHNYYKLRNEMYTYQRKRLMDKKKYDLYSLPKKGVLEAATVLATFSTPIIFNDKRSGSGRSHLREMKNRRSSSSVSMASASSSSPTTLHRSFIHPKKSLPLSCEGLNSNEMESDLSLLNLL